MILFQHYIPSDFPTGVEAPTSVGQFFHSTDFAILNFQDTLVVYQMAWRYLRKALEPDA